MRALCYENRTDLSPHVTNHSLQSLCEAGCSSGLASLSLKGERFLERVGCFGSGYFSPQQRLVILGFLGFLLSSTSHGSQR